MDIDLTGALAVYGAALSTFVLIRGIRRDLKDRGSLNVHVFVGRLVSAGVRSSRHHLVYRITNDGRRPAFLKVVGGKGAKRDFFIPVPQETALPKRLEPGEHVIITSPDLDDLDEVRCFLAIDTLGRIYKASRKATREVKRHAREALDEAR